MILTVTPNPSLDRTINLGSALQRGQVQRAVSVSAEPGGKGVNISRALSASGLDTVALLPGAATDPVLQALQALGIDYCAAPIPGALRSNVTLTEPDGTTTKVNEPGPELTAKESAALIEAAVRRSRDAQWLVLAGSLPPGVQPDFYARLISQVRSELGENAPRIAVDSSGEALRHAVAAGPDLIKPNTFELAELRGDGDGAELERLYGENPALAVAPLQELLASGVGSVLLTLGEYGAVYAEPGGVYSAKSPVIQAKSTVGAGDSALSGFLYASLAGLSAAERLAQAVAHGSAAAALAGSTMPTVHQTHPESITVQQLDPSGPTKESA